MQSVTVTIGRNVPSQYVDLATRAGLVDGPTSALSDQAWADFTELVVEALKNFESQVGGLESTWIETHDGIGSWDGVEEQSRKITLLFESESIPALERTALAIALASARSGYYQDAVAVSFGDSSLI